MNATQLKAAMLIQGYNAARLAVVLGISESSLYRKLSNRTEFTAGEIARIRDTLNLSQDDVARIFFAQQVS